jgi:SAM-dependent methyltransferase
VEHEPERRSIPPDYDEDHERFRLARSLVHRHSEVEDVHRRVAERMLAERLTPVLDVGCGEGELSRYLPEGAWVGLDSSAEMLSRAPHPSTQGKATALPFPDASFGAVALLYVLYHLDDPALALTEAQRVLRAGGMLAAAAPSQRDSPELAHALPARPSTFDAEIGPELVSEHFSAIEVERWDAPVLELPDAAAVRDYLVGKGTDPAQAEAAAAAARPPLRVTKRGALIFGRKPAPVG